MQIQAVTLIVDDLPSSRSFYEAVFDLPVHFADDESVVFDFHGVLVNLLAAPAGPELIDPVPLAPATAGVRMQLTVPVDDVDTAAARITALGIDLVRWAGDPAVGRPDRELPRPVRSPVGAGSLT